MLYLLFGILIVVGSIRVARVNASQLFEQFSMTNAERSFIQELRQNKKFIDGVIVSDINSMLILMYYIDTPSRIWLDGQHKNYVGLDQHKMMNFLNTSEFDLEEKNLLDHLQKQVGKEIYILISDRTRVAVSSFLAKGDPVMARGVPKNFIIYKRLPAEHKLKFTPFQLVYFNNNPIDSSFTELYKYEP